MIKIYFTASTTFDGEYRDHYKKIISLVKKHRVNLVSGLQIITDSLLAKDKKLGQKAIFERQKKLIEQSDCVIAELTKPSHGVGGEIVYALISNKPVLALVYQNQEDRVSPMVAGNPSEKLFLDFYNLDNLHYKITNFLNHIRSTKQRKGMLIVIDGGDGSGKTTQAHLLVQYLKKKSVLVKYVDFPQYYSSFHGKTVGKFLRGEFGQIDQVSPYLASLAFALDRASVKREMEDFLGRGGIIVANRYATSNIAHQAAKFKEKKQQEEYIKWIYELEYKVHKIPKENVVIYLYVPWEIGMYLTKNKPVRHYLNGENADIHEKDLLYRAAVEKMFLQLTKRYQHWTMIDCVTNGKILKPHDIHQKILHSLKKFNLLK